LWLLGYPEAALADTDRVYEDARGIGQAATLTYALLHLAITHILCGNYAAANADLDEEVALANEKGAVFFKAVGVALQGCVLALSSRASDAVHMMTSGIAALRSTGATLWVPVYLSHWAKALAELGQFDDARQTVDDAMKTAESSGERWCEAEIHRIFGEVALLSPERDAAKAQAHFERALEIARAQHARSWEL